MGGCRCTFRGCQNSTASSPGKHFFHYPTKDPERTKKWITFSNNFSFLDLDDSKLRNRNVCEDHFRVHMFMNIKKERLIRVAYPTLLKILKTGKVYDLEKMKEDNKLDATMTVKSEFDDEFDQYLVEDHENPTIVNLTSEETSSDSTKRESFSLNEQNIADIPIEFCDVNPKSVTQEPVKKIPEKIILTPVKKVLKRPAISENNSIVLTSVPIKKLKPCIKILNSTNIMKTISTETREIEPTISTNITPTTKILNRSLLIATITFESFIPAKC
uniref:CSON004500 protein n=1 Tax=Culicoides sonorensis TaxID=179676 RepID=A0A336MTJ7_CULSO